MNACVLCPHDGREGAPRFRAMPCRAKSGLCLLVLLLCALLSLTAPVRAASEVVSKAVSVVPPMSVFVEQDARVTVDQALALLREGRFQPVADAVPKFGIGSPPVWLHFQVTHTGLAPLAHRMFVGVPWLDQVDVYVLHDGQVVAAMQAGDADPALRGPVGSLGFAFDHAFRSGMSEVLLRVRSADPMVLPVRVLALEEATALQRRHDYGFGLLYGYLLALMAYNAMIFLGLRDRSHLDYLLYVGTFFLLSLAYSGHGLAWLWPGRTGLQQYVILVLMVLLACFGLRFANGFLGLSTQMPGMQRKLRAFCVTALLIMACCVLLGLQAAAAVVAFVVVLAFSVLMCWLGGVGLRLGTDGAAYFLFGALAGMLGAAITALAVWRGLPFSDGAFHAAELGFAVDGTVLALALADRMRRIRLKQLKAEHLAAIDPLTGLRNRRAFMQLAAPLWSTAVRNDRPLALIVLDLDHFKLINDTYGHATGDEVLVEAARVIERDCRAGDITARWGGEEFIVLMPETTSLQAHAMAERLLVGVRGIAIERDGVRLALSASVGVAGRGAHPDFEALIREADAWMYSAKRGGRNRVSGLAQPSPA